MNERRTTSRRAADIELLEAQTDLKLREAIDQEQKDNKDKYAIKLVEKIVFALLAMAFIGMSAYFWHIIISLR